MSAAVDPLRSAIAEGDLGRVRQLAADRDVTLDEATLILGLIRRQQPDKFEAAAVRWMSRYAAERALTIDDLGFAVDMLDLLREDAGALVSLRKMLR